MTSIENKRFSKIISHTISPKQFALGDTKRIHYAIALARDAIYTSSQRNKRCAIADLDLKSALDLLCMDWVFTVLKVKGLDPEAIKRLRRCYKDIITIPIVNEYTNLFVEYGLCITNK